MMIHIEGEDNILEDEEEEDAEKDQQLKAFFEDIKKIGPFSK